MVKRYLLAGVALSLALAPVALAAPKDSAPPTHGCDQAAENDGDVYDSTCDGSASENGKGDGNATGKPCAGCVGAADNKNPKGQMPNGGDANAGYECDRNQGVGQSNPAHTSCDAYSGAAPKSNASFRGKVRSDFQPEAPGSGFTGAALVLVLAVLLLGGTATRMVWTELFKGTARK